MKENTLPKRFNAPTAFFRRSIDELQLPNSGKIHSYFTLASKDRFFVLFFCIWLLPILLASVYVLWNFSNLPREIPLFYSRTWGERQLVRSTYIYLPLLGTFLLGVLNIAFASVIYSRDKVLAYVLVGAASLISVLAALTVFNIVNLFR